MALLGIQSSARGLEVSFLKLGDDNESFPAQENATPSAPPVASPRFLLDTEREGSDKTQGSQGILERILACTA